MRESMLGRIVLMLVTAPAERLGALADFIEKMVRAEQEWWDAFLRFLRKEEAWSGKKSILRFLSRLAVKGAKKFVARDAFRFNADPGQRVHISRLGDNFKRQFLPKVEENVPDATLGTHELLEGSRNMRIVAELGYEEGVEIFLAHFYEVLATKQAANDLTWTVGYARDKDGNLCPVGAYWDVGGWLVDADSLGHPDWWALGGRFLSRNS